MDVSKELVQRSDLDVHSELAEWVYQSDFGPDNLLWGGEAEAYMTHVIMS